MAASAETGGVREGEVWFTLVELTAELTGVVWGKAKHIYLPYDWYGVWVCASRLGFSISHLGLLIFCITRSSSLQFLFIWVWFLFCPTSPPPTPPTPPPPSHTIFLPIYMEFYFNFSFFPWCFCFKYLIEIFFTSVLHFCSIFKSSHLRFILILPTVIPHRSFSSQCIFPSVFFSR